MDGLSSVNTEYKDPIDDSKSADFMTRVMMSFAKDPNAKAHALAHRFGKENVFVVDDPESKYSGQLAFRDPKTGSFHPADENNFTLKDYADWVGSAPEIALSVIGGIGGGIITGLPTAGTGAAGGSMIGAGSGAGAGEYIRHSLASAMGLPEGDSAEVTRGIKNAVIANTAGEGVGQGIGAVTRAGQRFMTPTAEEIATKQMFDKNNMPHLLSDVKKSKPLALVESALANMPTSADVYNDIALRQLERYGAMGDEVISSAGGPMSDVVAGEAAKKGLKDKATLFSSVVRPLYDQVGELMGGVKAQPNNTIAAINKLRDETRIGRSGQLESLFQDIEQVLKETGGEISYSDLDRASSRVGQLANSGAVKMDGNGRLFRILGDSIKADMAQMVDASGIEGAKELHKYADDIYKYGITGAKEAGEYNRITDGLEGAVKLPEKGFVGDDIPAREVFDNTTASAMNKTESGAKILEMIKPKDTEGILRQRKLMGEEAWNQSVAPAWLTKNIEGIEGKLVKDGVEISFVSPDKFLSFMNKWDSKMKDTRMSALDLILPKQSVDQLRNMEKLARNTNTANRLAGNYSGTARVGGTMDIINKAMSAPATIILPIGQAALAGGAAYGTAKDWDENTVMGKVVDGAALASVLIGPRMLAKGLTNPKTLSKLTSAKPANTVLDMAINAATKTPTVGAGLLSTRKLRDHGAE